MKKFVPLLLALGLWAADSWQNKPMAEWSDKDVQKILSNSPWAKVISVSTGGLMDSGSMPERGGRFGGDDSQPRSSAEQMPGASAGVPGGNMPSRGIDGGLNSPAGASIPISVVWESALPVKQALARRKYGAEAGTSPEAQKFLDQNGSYVIAVAGIPDALAQAGATHGKAALLAETSLSAKGKPLLHATGVEVGPPGKAVEVIFTFDKTAPFSIEDKEVEFSTQFGAVAVRYKFRLKDMLYQGKLEL
ncbi:MAG TPA: hypothetical protein VMH05_23455 [Bryobacteraceae bacterium]|nr:hypothetical protein [Bryobacteraceae bacterium]